MPPAGGFEAIKYKRNLPFRGPSGLVILGGVTAVCAYGFYRLGQGNLEKRCEILSLDCRVYAAQRMTKQRISRKTWLDWVEWVRASQIWSGQQAVKRGSHGCPLIEERVLVWDPNRTEKRPHCHFLIILLILLWLNEHSCSVPPSRSVERVSVVRGNLYHRC